MVVPLEGFARRRREVVERRGQLFALLRCHLSEYSPNGATAVVDHAIDQPLAVRGQGEDTGERAAWTTAELTEPSRMPG